MKQDHDEAELDTDAAAFLDSVRGLDEPSAKDRHRVRRRVLAAVAATGAASAAGGTAATAAAATGGAAGATAGAGVIGTTLAAKVWIGVAIGLVGAGVAGGVATLAPDDEVVVADAEPAEPTEATEVVPEAAPADRASVSEPEPEPEPPELLAEPEPEVLGQGVPIAPEAPRVPSTTRRAPEPSVAPAVAPAAEPAADPDTLVVELGLIRRAHAAANAGNHTEALRILGEHAARFPSGSLAVEREGARAISLCGAGRTTEGRPLAERFLRAHPGSPLRSRVSRACAD